MQKIIIGSDHGGFKLKNWLKIGLGNCDIVDIGCNTAEPVDFPLIAKAVVECVLKESAIGVLVCGSGIGVSIAANRFRGIRAARCCDVSDAILAKEHNNANVLCLAGRGVKFKSALKIVKSFINAKFLDEEKYKRRNVLLDTL